MRPYELRFSDRWDVVVLIQAYIGPDDIAARVRRRTCRLPVITGSQTDHNAAPRVEPTVS